MSARALPTLMLVLTENEGLGTIAVDLEEYLAFSFELEDDLDDLVSRWAPAPREAPVVIEARLPAGRAALLP